MPVVLAKSRCQGNKADPGRCTFPRSPMYVRPWGVPPTGGRSRNIAEVNRPASSAAQNGVHAVTHSPAVAAKLASKPIGTAMHTHNPSDWLRSNTATAPQGASKPSSQRALPRAEQRCPLAGSAVTAWIRWGWRCLGTAVFLLLSVPAPAAPRPPLPPLPEMHLREWRFDNAFRQYPFGEAPPLIPEADLVESWSGYALRREGQRAVPFVVPETEPTNRVNFTCGTGTIRFWFRPNWGSASLDGRGPAGFARLVEMVSLNGATSTVWWSLYATPDGTALYCSGQGRTGPTDLLKTEIQWAAETWHLVALTYNPTNSTLFVDGALAALGDPLPVPPIPSAPEMALVLGSDLTGTGLAQGHFDEFTTFNRACDPWAMDWYHEATARHVARGPVSAEEVAATQAQRAAASMRMAASAMAVADGGGQMLRLLGETTSCITNVPVFITNIFSKFDTNQGWTVTFDIQGGTNGLMYDIFTTTNLAGNNVTNSQWTWLEQGPTCSTYQYTNQPQPYAFYLLGTPQDSDGDGLTDAFEKLITRTNVSTNDTDGDGVSDYLEWLQGRNPNAAGTAPDANSQIHLELYTPLR